MVATNGDATDKSVKATFNYTKDIQPELTEIYFYDHPDAEKVHQPGDEPHELPVHDGWSHKNEFTLDKNGFSLGEFDTKFDKWEDSQAVTSELYPAIEQYLKDTLGCKRVLIFDHTIRSKKNQAKKLSDADTSQRAPVMLVHCDYTAESGPLRVQQLLPKEADDLLTRRVAFINVWKPTKGIVKEKPLAMCDVTSAPQSDFFKLYLRYQERTGENYVMRYNPEHKWWYFPEMSAERGDTILLKTYDSQADGTAQFVGHSAFEDPNTAEDAPARESIEIRTICFY